ncbi:MAG: alpha/beta hydrolase [Oceanospirillaceae bacterium]|nr:alpha/beta hydrolase [Oceanospirillaceae bacterium]|tara:strand:- start:32416 stop:33426 length:1011 start_codon:yes stop_codon:yes gene_type:complete
MPLITSDYRSPWLVSNGYVQSILPTLIRTLPDQHLQRERIATDDGDFLDLDWSRCGSETLVIVSHGLEGHSRRPYVLGTLREANRRGWDGLGWNFRSCGGDMNLLPRMYHSGATDDLHRVVQHALLQGYRRIHLVGYSMGGNLSLVYAGREAHLLPQEVKSVAAFSVPCDLQGSAWQLAKWQNRVFMWKFLKDLQEKMEVKARMFPQLVSAEGFADIKNFKQFDDRYTAPLHGFADAEDYWHQSGSIRYLEQIKIPALLVNADNDPFLSDSCYPREFAAASDHFTLEIPASGGHVGFILRTPDQTYWMEQRAADFISLNNAEADMAEAQQRLVNCE